MTDMAELEAAADDWLTEFIAACERAKASLRGAIDACDRAAADCFMNEAIVALTRAADTCERWGCSAQDYVHRVAADALRRAGRDDLATRCEEVDGPHGAARILAELEAVTTEPSQEALDAAIEWSKEDVPVGGVKRSLALILDRFAKQRAQEERERCEMLIKYFVRDSREEREPLLRAIREGRKL